MFITVLNQFKCIPPPTLMLSSQRNIYSFQMEAQKLLPKDYDYLCVGTWCVIGESDFPFHFPKHKMR